MACIVRVAHWECWRYRTPHACRIWRRHEPEAHIAAAGIDGIPGYTSFDQCVGFRESGNTWTEDTGNGYYGAFQWVPSTWASVLAMMHVTGPPDPAAASPALQVRAFNYWAPRDPGAWPNTIPPCGGA